MVKINMPTRRAKDFTGSLAFKVFLASIAATVTASLTGQAIARSDADRVFHGV